MKTEQETRKQIARFEKLLEHPHYSKNKTFKEYFFPGLYDWRLQDRYSVEGIIQALRWSLGEYDGL